MMKYFLQIIFAAIFLLAGCKEKPCPISEDPKIALIDVNASSDTRGQGVLPDNYRGKVSAWFFGNST
jgi:uncharacterized lipoprotein YajG